MSDPETKDVKDARAQLRAVLVPAAIGCLGATSGAAGALDPVTLFAWLVLAAPACGVLAGAFGVRLWPVGLLAPALWIALLVQAELGSERHLLVPWSGMAVVSGLFFAGLGLGAWVRRRSRPERGLALAGLLLCGMLAASGAGVRGVLSSSGSGFAREFPWLTTTLLEASPLVFAFECAGVDYTHMQPDVYARSTVEWFPRLPYRGALAAPVVLLVGSLSALLGARGDKHRFREAR